MERIVIEYGNYLKEKRLVKGYSQSQVAEMLGISQQRYSYYELGKRMPGLNFLVQISRILDFEPGEFFDNYED